MTVDIADFWSSHLNELEQALLYRRHGAADRLVAMLFQRERAGQLQALAETNPIAWRSLRDRWLSLRCRCPFPSEERLAEVASDLKAEPRARA